MGWLLVLFVVFVALAPLISLMPTRQQKLLASLRQAAAEAGLQVQLRELPGYSLEKTLEPAYGLRTSRDCRISISASYRRDDEQWIAIGAKSAPIIETSAAVFPAGVGYLTVTPDSVLVFWDERGTPEDVRLIKEGLQSVIDSISASQK